MLVAAVADIHAPLKLKWFMEKVSELREDPEIFFFLGDLVEKNQHFYIKKIYNIVKLYLPNTKIYSVFGNNEWYEYRSIYKQEYSYMNWLDDEFVELNGYVIYGTEGVLDRLTSWMRHHFPKMQEIFNERLKKIVEFLNTINKQVIFISHYAPVCKTVFGDPTPYFYLCSKKLEQHILNNSKVRYILHGHAHFAKITHISINEKEIYNVSAYATDKITLLNI